MELITASPNSCGAAKQLKMKNTLILYLNVLLDLWRYELTACKFKNSQGTIINLILFFNTIILLIPFLLWWFLKQLKLSERRKTHTESYVSLFHFNAGCGVSESFKGETETPSRVNFGVAPRDRPRYLLLVIRKRHSDELPRRQLRIPHRTT